jgi:hypothetical protein
MEPEEKKKHTVMQQINSLRNVKLQKRKEKQREKTAAYVKKKEQTSVRPRFLLHYHRSALIRCMLQEFFKPQQQAKRKREFQMETAKRMRTLKHS